MEGTRRPLRHRRRATRGGPRGLPRAAWLLALASAIWVIASGSAGVLAGASAGGLAGASAGGLAGPAAASSRTADPGSWTVYHHDAAGTGVAGRVASVDTASRAWTSPALDGQIYGEPLVWAGRVYVATENDTVYALSAASGAVVWSAHLGRPVPASALPCGNITPAVGITGTPVIDPARGEIFVVAEELVNGAPAHILVGLGTATGKTEMTQDVDPAGANTAALLQRTGLTLDAGQVVFGFGGNYGDCSTYRGRLVAVSETGGTPTGFAVDAAAGQSEGAIWMGGAAPAVDDRGHLWVSVGNGSVTSAARPYDNSDSVLELSPSLRLLQFFAPAAWASNNAHDLDMSAGPALLADGQMVAADKTGSAYLLSGANLGGIGGQLATLRSACSGVIAGGTAVRGTTVYLPCLSGITAVQTARSGASLDLLWSSGQGGGPPIVAAGLVWTIGQNGMLYGLDPATGAVRQSAQIGRPANHFPTASVGDGLLLAPAARDVVAFAAPAHGRPVTATPTPAATSTVPGPSQASDLPGTSTTAHGGARSPAAIAAIAGIVAAVLAVIGGAGWLLRRRRGLRAR